MDDAEREICLYLKTVPEQSISTREICRRAGGKWRYRENEEWAVPVLLLMVQKGIIEEDANGHYRVAEEERKDKKERKPTWVAPHIQKILAKGGVTVSKTYDVGNSDGTYIKISPPEPAQPSA